MTIRLAKDDRGWSGTWVGSTDRNLVAVLMDALRPFVTYDNGKEPRIPGEHYSRLIAVLRLNGIEVEIGEGL